MEAWAQVVADGVLVLFLADLPVAHPDPVTILEKLSSWFLSPPRVWNFLRVRASIGPPVHQYLSGNHVWKLLLKLKKFQVCFSSLLPPFELSCKKKKYIYNPPPERDKTSKNSEVLQWYPTGWKRKPLCSGLTYFRPSWYPRSDGACTASLEQTLFPSGY